MGECGKKVENVVRVGKLEKFGKSGRIWEDNWRKLERAEKSVKS